MSVSDVIALLGLAVSVVIAGLAYAYQSGKTDATIKAMGDRIDEMRAEHTRSATDQGNRLGELKDLVGTLFDFKNRYEGAREERIRHDTRGVPIRGDEG